MSAHSNDLVSSAGKGHAQLGPLRGLAVLSVDVGELLKSDRRQRVVFVDVDRQGVIANGEFLGILAGGGLGLFALRRSGSSRWKFSLQFQGRTILGSWLFCFHCRFG